MSFILRMTIKHLSCDIRISLLEDRNDQSERDIMEVRQRTFDLRFKVFYDFEKTQN